MIQHQACGHPDSQMLRSGLDLLLSVGQSSQADPCFHVASVGISSANLGYMSIPDPGATVFWLAKPESGA